MLKLARGGSYLGTVGVSPPAWTRKAGERGALEPPCLKAQSPTRYAPRRRGARGRRSVSDCEFATRAESLKRKGPEHSKKRRRSRAWTVRFSFAQDRTVLHAHSSQYSPAWHRSFVQTTDSRLPTYPEATTGDGPPATGHCHHSRRRQDQPPPPERRRTRCWLPLLRKAYHYTSTRPVSSPESAVEPSPCPHQGPLPTPPHHNHNSPPLPSSATRISSLHRPRSRARARGGLDQQGVLVTAFPGALGLRVARKARFPRYKCDPKALGREEPCRLQRQHNEFRDGL